ncbi:hypothetical protein [Desulfobacter sp. UBA2225]|uniref:hypothetical protein n=1 Tax=Desulfobacter sp. UBA2225 TaxID=1961413 RepID=UPI002579B067|nr:hypothetical protein [Desulfobacter sp. UBA2225]
MPLASKTLLFRYDIRNVAFVQRICRFLVNNVGSLVTARKISTYLKSQQEQRDQAKG